MPSTSVVYQNPTEKVSLSAAVYSVGKSRLSRYYLRLDVGDHRSSVEFKSEESLREFCAKHNIEVKEK